MEDKNLETTVITAEDFHEFSENLKISNKNQELYAKKQCQMSQITAVVSMLILAIVIYACGTIIPRMNTMFNHLDFVMEDIQVISSELAEADLDQMIRSIDHLVSSSEKGVNDALGQINSIDIATLNKAIKDLSDIISPLARLFGR